jgi:hypothetical protein
MSLSADVVAAVHEHGRQTILTLLERFPDADKRRMKIAIQTAKDGGGIVAMPRDSRGHTVYVAGVKRQSKRAVSLIALVRDAVADGAGATALQVSERLEGYTLHQVRKALDNAVANGHLVTTRFAGVGDARVIYRCPHDRTDGLFLPNRTDPDVPRYASVWNYAQGISANESTNRRQA